MGLAELTVRYQQDCPHLEAPREVCLLAHFRPPDAALFLQTPIPSSSDTSNAGCLSQAGSPSLTYMVPTRVLLIYLILFIYILK